ncbi:hypothetical protein PC41400_03860 [Paenibacillus chitinolyticus]|uniref:Uncharacterized protein n=1 Tax=Paenibacillus chitinolyticus TaxID=79263 RepID=A0A410WR69_9BACL|nr:hypothetical protein [Paenibacillus chitinolyticus]MCY9591542.1 hypothetical protein [Paenibacillus chitinolyticus]MCY9594625.1 hypothetical protein [Paenibacillus chitinolyticus]QAV16865.1 hypothetical protein PC41400_03860 [Paenibacillus chitinolyticus]
MKTRKKKKGMYIALLVLLGLLGLLVGSLYNSLNGNPLSKWLAQRELQQFMVEHYPEKRLRIEKGFYDFKFKRYEFRVKEIGVDADKGEPAEYEFSVGGWIPKVKVDGIRSANLDMPLMERLRGEAEAELQAAFARRVPAVREVSVQLEVVKGQLAENAAWTPSLKLDEPLYIHVVTDAAGASKQQVAEAAAEIAAVLDAGGYDYGHVTINSNVMDDEAGKDPYGYVKYVARFDKGGKVSAGDVEEVTK